MYNLHRLERNGIQWENSTEIKTKQGKKDRNQRKVKRFRTGGDEKLIKETSSTFDLKNR